MGHSGPPQEGVGGVVKQFGPPQVGVGLGTGSLVGRSLETGAGISVGTNLLIVGTVGIVGVGVGRVGEQFGPPQAVGPGVALGVGPLVVCTALGLGTLVKYFLSSSTSN